VHDRLQGGSLGVVAQGGSDAGVSGQAQDGDGQVNKEAGHDAGAVAGADLGGILTECHIADPVQAVLD